MEGALILLLLFTLFVIVGGILGWIALFRGLRLEKTVRAMEIRLRDLDRRTAKVVRAAPEIVSGHAAETPARVRPEREPEPATPRMTPALTGRAPVTPSQRMQSTRSTQSKQPTSSTESTQPDFASQPVAARVAEDKPFDEILDHLKRNWMAWLGGICVALAGVFLVIYGIEMGFLGPQARIVAAVVAGIVLHVAAEYFRRRTQTAHPAFAAMAGGASITLYAAFFAALELYDLLSPTLAFALLALVSLASMALALVHGPLLAAIGILGAYVVPILISNVAANGLVELGYSLVVTAAAFLLIRFVYRPWLWCGTLVGALGWWLVSLSGTDADGFRGWYLAAFTYLALAVPGFDWALARRGPEVLAARLPSRFGLTLNVIQLTMLFVTGAAAISIAHLGFTGLGPALALWSPLIVIVLRASRSRESLKFAPWLILLTQLGAWLYIALDTGRGITLAGLALPMQDAFLLFALAMAALFSGGMLLARLGRPFRHIDSSLVCLAPILWLGLAYLLVTDLSIAWEWSVATIGLGAAYMFVAARRVEREPDGAAALWLIVGAHAAWSLAAAMAFREATLTLALAAQVVSLAWLRQRFALPALDWIVKGVLALIVVRLTLNPWLASYPADVHWSLWTYGGSALCCAIASALTPRSHTLRKWLGAVSLHLLVLFLGAETRYWLYGGRIFIEEFTLTEAAIDTLLWGGLAITYYRRALVGEQLAAFYTICSRILLAMAAASYGLVLTTLNPLWSFETVGQTPLWNVLLPAYGAPVLIALAIRRLHESRFRNAATVVAGAGLFAFVSIEIRHLWQRALDLDLGVVNGELYTYSAVWLVMAVITMLAATRLHSRDGYRAGIGLLCLVIGKIFLVDMEGLEGLLRVASFMGLGLALLGLAWLYQRTARERNP